MPTNDTLILGLGAMGSAAAAACSQRGHRVLGLEQHAFAHSQGSSHGHSRIIREVYYEHPAYVPLVQEAFRRWEGLEKSLGQSLLTRCPCANIGPAASPIIQGVQAAARKHDLPAETWSAGDLRLRLPQFRLPDDYVAVVEARAGWLRVEACVAALQEQARRLGAVLQENEPVLSWTSTGKAVEIVTANGTYQAKNLIITAGPWAARLLQDLNLPLRIMRQMQLWFAVPEGPIYRSPVFPIFLVDTPQGAFYGLPADAGPGLKLAQHYGAPELSHPDEIHRELTDNDVLPIRGFLSQHLPALANPPLVEHATCIYTLTPDRHFLIDRHPHYGNVAFACGFSGHGFKFAPVIGEILADYADQKPPQRNLSLFQLNRFQSSQLTTHHSPTT